MNENKGRRTAPVANSMKTHVLCFTIGAVVGVVGWLLSIPFYVRLAIGIPLGLAVVAREQLRLSQQKTRACNSENIDDILARIDANIAEMRAFLADRPELEGEVDELRRSAERQLDDTGDRRDCTNGPSPSRVSV